MLFCHFVHVRLSHLDYNKNCQLGIDLWFQNFSCYIPILSTVEDKLPLDNLNIYFHILLEVKTSFFVELIDIKPPWDH